MDDSKWDDLILAAASTHWRKVARIIADVSTRAGSENFDAIESRIRALVDDGKLEAEGTISRWRFSEVRLAQSHPPNRGQ